MKHTSIGLAIIATAFFATAGCGGGGGGGSSPTTAPAASTPTATPSGTPAPPTTVAGTVYAIPSDAYGPTTIAGTTYQSSDATQTTPLSGATVIVGPVPIVGATAPATLPAGDVSAITAASGTFSVTPSIPPAAPSTSEPFVIPPSNLTGFTAPVTGYYVQVFGPGTDGLSAGVPLPLHRFFAASTSLALRVSMATAAEAGALVTINSDRSSNGAAPLTFDESAEEAARLHASDMAAKGYLCHYDLNNIGPASRYLQVGGIGLSGESIDDDIATNASTAFSIADAAFMAEKTQSPPGGHYENNVDPAHLWAGFGAFPSAVYGGNYDVDYELITPSAQDSIVGASGYTNSGCSANIFVNNS